VGRLVLSRRIGESLKIGDHITITVSDYHGGQVKLVIDAPKEVIVDRQEIWERKMKEKGNDRA
jgi:carbon storage regulator